jgi:nucleoside-diphosphate-sugar epimerase
MGECIIVFGGSGFVGRNLIARLAPRGVRLISVSRTGAPVPGATESYAMDHLCDIADLSGDAIVVNVAAHRYDAARFDLAQSEILLANAALTETVYGFCLDRGIKEVRAASSVAVYPAGLDILDDAVPVDLNRLPNPNETFYGWSKRWSELLARLYADKYGIATLSFRISNAYGPLDSTDIGNAHVLPAFVMRALQPAPNFEIKGNPDVERDFIYISDICEIFEASFDLRGLTDALNLCTGQTTRLRDLATTLLKLTGDNRPLVTSAAAVQGVAARRSTNQRLRETFGKTAFVGLEEGLRQTLDWYRHELAPSRP